TAKLEEFCHAFIHGDGEKMENILNRYLKQTISIRDTSVRDAMKENFYHGILLGLLSFQGSWYVRSNAERGDGFADIVVYDPDSETAVVVEIKYARDGSLEQACEKAIEQIEEKNYGENSADSVFEEADRIRKCGVAFYKKKCKVKCV
ncbi:MAG: PD-(D/E)XK nuclease domain-containing protein, partial [Lachnospiraceae bacterium]|nr:PD-(D/E)XK nuclease domain-containing protein [Lachnospiraceae bacterium]